MDLHRNVVSLHLLRNLQKERLQPFDRHHLEKLLQQEKLQQDPGAHHNLSAHSQKEHSRKVHGQRARTHAEKALGNSRIYD
jgi:hypothetical protein